MGGDALKRVLQGAALLGLAGVMAAYFWAPRERFWANWLFWYLALATVGLGSLFIVALEHLVGARWSVPLRRVPERVSSLLLAAIPVGLVGLLSLPVLYPWARPGEALSKLVAGKASWLNVPFFSLRAVVCFALWGLFWWLFVRASLRQDESADPALTVRMRRLAPAFMAVFAVTITVVAFDWLSSMEPEWYSDIFGVYVFAGSFLAGLAATSLAAAWLLKRGRLEGVRSDHLYNLGGFLFAFTVFWSYIGFAQYMLMWYGNMPEEVFWYKDRIEGPWLPVVLALAALHFLVPFFALIPRGAKGDPKQLTWVAALVLLSHAVDLYWLIFPSVFDAPVFSWPEAAFALLFLSVMVLWVRQSMALGRDMPVGDPFLKEGLEFRL